MAVCLISREYSTNHCVFSFDNWANDEKLLPNLNSVGKGTLSTIKSCCQGSLARGTDGTTYVLTGANIWRLLPTGGGSTPTDPDNGFIEL